MERSESTFVFIIVMIIIRMLCFAASCRNRQRLREKGNELLRPTTDEQQQQRNHTSFINVST